MNNDVMEKLFNDFSRDIRIDFEYLGLYMFVLFKRHKEHDFLSNDVVNFIQSAFDSNSIDFERLLFKYDLLKDIFVSDCK